MVPTKYLHRFTQCVTASGTRKHWGAPVSAQHPLARVEHPAGTLAPYCMAPAYAVPARPLPSDSDLKGCAHCARIIHSFPD